MVINSKVPSLITKENKENITIKMEIITKVHGQTILRMDMVDLYLETAKFTKGNLNRVQNMETANTFGKTDKSIREGS